MFCDAARLDDGGQDLANAVAAVHALAYPAEKHFGVPHGLSNALVLMDVMRFNMDHALACAGLRFSRARENICRDCGADSLAAHRQSEHAFAIYSGAPDIKIRHAA